MEPNNKEMTPAENEAQWERLKDAVGSGERRRVLEALEGTDEGERASLYARLVELGSADDTPLHERSALEKEKWFAHAFAEAGTVPMEELEALAMYQLAFRPTEKDGLIGFELLQQRSAPWRERWRERLLSGEWGSIGSLLVAVREGYCEAPARPTDPERLAQAHANILRLARDAWGKDTTLEERLAAQPWTLTWPVDLLFELEGSGEASLAAVDKYLPDHATWSTTLGALVASGALDRERVIDGAMRAMASDFATFRAGWFQRFFRGLALTDEEAVARLTALYGLLASPAPATASTVLERLSLLQRAGALEPSGFVKSVGPCLLHKAKKTPLLAIKMLSAAAKAEPSLGAQVGETVALALSHPHTDIQGKALALTESLGGALSEQTRERVAEAAPFLSATLTQGALSAAAAATFEELPGPEPLPSPRAAWAPTGDPVEPIESMEALVLEAVHHLETSDDVIREEILLDAFLRFAAPPADSAEHATLGKAAQRALKRSSGESYGNGHIAARQFAAVLLAWLAQNDPGAPAEGVDVDKNHMGTRLHPGMEVLRKRRLTVVLRLRSKKPQRLWSLPTHSCGSIDAEEAKARWAQCDLPADDPDRLVLWARACALLAPDPATVDVAAKVMTKTRGEKPYFFSWLAVDPASTVQMPSVPGLLLASSNSDDPDGWRDTHSLPDPLHIRSAASLCVRYPEIPMTLAARAIASNLDFDEARWSNRHFLEPLLWPGLRFGPAAHLALAVGLAAKETQERAIAIDACIEASEEGRARAAALGAEIAGLLATRLAKPQRWNASLTEVAAASPSHAEFVGRTVAAALELEPGVKPRGIAALFELLVEVQAVAGVAPLTARARAYLSAFKGSSKGAKLARALLKVQPEAPS